MDKRKSYASQGRRYLEQGHHEKALEYFDKAIESDGKPDSWLGKAEVLVQLKRYAEALQCFDMAIGLAGDAACWHGKGSALLQAGMVEKAVECFDNAIKLKPDYSDAWFGKGESLHKLQKLEEAANCYSAAVKINPGNASAWKNLGDILRLTTAGYPEAVKCYNKALDLYEKHLKQNPKDCQIWRKKSLAASALGLDAEYKRCYDSAIACYQQRLKNNPDDAVAWYSLAAMPVGQFSSFLKTSEEYLGKAKALGMNIKSPAK